MSSIKTTILGVLSILSAVSGSVTALLDADPLTNPDWTVVAAAVSAGIGLIMARDNSVSSEKAGAK